MGRGKQYKQHGGYFFLSTGDKFALFATSPEVYFGGVSGLRGKLYNITWGVIFLITGGIFALSGTLPEV